jgi:hypothetical protein
MIPGNRVSVDGPVGRGQQHAGPAQRRRPSCGGGSRVSGKEPFAEAPQVDGPLRLAASRKTRSVKNPAQIPHPGHVHRDSALINTATRAVGERRITRIRPARTSCSSGRHNLGDRTGDSDPHICPVWIVSRTPMPLPHRSSACWSQPNADGLVVPHVGPLVEGKRRELDRRDVCPGDPTGQRRAPDPAVKSSTRGSRTLHSRSRLRCVHVRGLYWATPSSSALP